GFSGEVTAFASCARRLYAGGRGGVGGAGASFVAGAAGAGLVSVPFSDGGSSIGLPPGTRGDGGPCFFALSKTPEKVRSPSPLSTMTAFAAFGLGNRDDRFRNASSP